MGYFFLNYPIRVYMGLVLLDSCKMEGKKWWKVEDGR